jgi:NADH:ubiquinone oxidoreductase subunit F (NADH-binding)
LTDADLRALSQRLAIPLYELEGLVSFYPHFRRNPTAALRVGVCRDLACFLRDEGRGEDDLASLCRGREDVELEAISCPGLCDRAPACLVNEVPATLGQARACVSEGRAPVREAGPSPRRSWQVDPYPGPGDHYGELRRRIASGELEGVIDRLAESGLRGMGGAGFPVARKWELVRDQPRSPKVVVCNADESEPGAFKDRVLLEELPHLVIEGCVLAGLAVGAEEGWIYIRHEYGRAREILQQALDAARREGVLGADVCGSGRRFELRIFVSPGGYILGEETALLEALEGKRGEPRNKPPFPGVVGLHGMPTVVNNVESLAHVPRALRTGEAELKFFSVSGDVRQPGVVEAPLGISLRELVERCGGMRDGADILAFLPGGASTGFLPGSRADVVMDWDSLREAGSALGAGAIVVVGAGADLLGLGRNLTAFFRNESCGKCVPCRIGTEKAVVLIDRREGEGLALLSELDEALRETSLCGLGQVALTPILSLLEHFPELREPEKTP